ncbi:hypothetical protein E3P86_02322 [Wallemia ichthyophaga]|uniref:Uncharacterized protein n=1 Tax=Wallemia ichthyophaga TaxID=245174 RepID=A0A4T0J3J7_WALIC|nr:hypothetical protein E3P86_02322 [Wallemia ichthyophaga]
MLAMMNRERDKENKKLLYTENIAEISKKTKNAQKNTRKRQKLSLRPTRGRCHALGISKTYL